MVATTSEAVIADKSTDQNEHSNKKRSAQDTSRLRFRRQNSVHDFDFCFSNSTTTIYDVKQRLLSAFLEASTTTTNRNRNTNKQNSEMNAMETKDATTLEDVKIIYLGKVLDEDAKTLKSLGVPAEGKITTCHVHFVPASMRRRSRKGGSIGLKFMVNSENGVSQGTSGRSHCCIIS